MLGYHRRAFECPRAPAMDRGPLQFLIDEAALFSWSQPVPTGRRGKPFVYPDSLILSSLILKNHYRLPYRMTATLFGTMLNTLRVPIPPPDHSTLYYRHGRVGEKWPTLPLDDAPCIVVEGHCIRSMAMQTQPSDLSPFHTVDFQVDAIHKKMILECRMRLDRVVHTLSELANNTAAASARLDHTQNKYSKGDALCH